MIRESARLVGSVAGVTAGCCVLVGLAVLVRSGGSNLLDVVDLTEMEYDLGQCRAEAAHAKENLRFTTYWAQEWRRRWLVGQHEMAGVRAAALAAAMAPRDDLPAPPAATVAPEPMIIKRVRTKPKPMKRRRPKQVQDWWDLL